MPRFEPASPPMKLVSAPVAVTLAVEVPLVIVAPALFIPTSPPTETKVPVAVTVLPALRFDRLALLLPISPPMLAKLPVLTLRRGHVRLVMVAPASLSPTSPPSQANWKGAPVPLTLPDAAGCADRTFVLSDEAACRTRSAVHDGRCGRILDAAKIPSDQAAEVHQQALGAGDPIQAAACARIVDGAAGIVGADQAAADAVRAVERDRRVRRNLSGTAARDLAAVDADEPARRGDIAVDGRVGDGRVLNDAGAVLKPTSPPSMMLWLPAPLPEIVPVVARVGDRAVVIPDEATGHRGRGGAGDIARGAAVRDRAAADVESDQPANSAAAADIGGRRQAVDRGVILANQPADE